MGLKSKIIGTIAGLSLSSVLGFGLYGLHQNCQRNSQEAMERFRDGQVPIIAEVLTESYENHLSPVKKWNGAFSYSNPTVKLDSKYTLKCKTKSGHHFGLSVVDGGSVTKESLDQLIDVGSRIYFPRGNFSQEPNGPWLPEYREETCFKQDTQAGSKRADRIRVLNVE